MSEPLTLTCRTCGVIDAPQVAPGSGPHSASLRCRHCGGFLCWRPTPRPPQEWIRVPYLKNTVLVLSREEVQRGLRRGKWHTRREQFEKRQEHTP
jgi:hypothetical protein